MGRDNESSDHFKNGDLAGRSRVMAHAMTSAMTLMMALMMTAMAGSVLAWGARKAWAAARRAPGGPRGATAGPGRRGDG
jgi:hypothetical protein